MNDYALAAILLFIIAFAFTDGPVAMMYGSEIVMDSALGFMYFTMISSILIL